MEKIKIDITINNELENNKFEEEFWTYIDKLKFVKELKITKNEIIDNLLPTFMDIYKHKNEECSSSGCKYDGIHKIITRDELGRVYVRSEYCHIFNVNELNQLSSKYLTDIDQNFILELKKIKFSPQTADRFINLLKNNNGIYCWGEYDSCRTLLLFYANYFTANNMGTVAFIDNIAYCSKFVVDKKNNKDFADLAEPLIEADYLIIENFLDEGIKSDVYYFNFLNYVLKSRLSKYKKTIVGSSFDLNNIDKVFGRSDFVSRAVRENFFKLLKNIIFVGGVLNFKTC